MSYSATVHGVAPGDAATSALRAVTVPDEQRAAFDAAVDAAGSLLADPSVLGGNPTFVDVTVSGHAHTGAANSAAGVCTISVQVVEQADPQAATAE